VPASCASKDEEAELSATLLLALTFAVMAMPTLSQAATRCAPDFAKRLP
jgi:hypothetical protein